MQQIVASCLLTLLLVPGTYAFAQFKNPAKVAKNLANLDVVIARSVTPAIGRPVVTQLPPDIVPGNAVGLLRVKMPRVVTPVNHSYVQYVHTLGANQLKAIAHNWIGPKGEHVLYDNQSQLARDLDRFYQGQADIYAGPDGHPVKLYMLPVNGILYKPAEYPVPLVLNAREYFVVYDVKTQTGQIAQNTPHVYNLYKRVEPSALHQQLEGFYRHAKKAVVTQERIEDDLYQEIKKAVVAYPQEPTCRTIPLASNHFRSVLLKDNRFPLLVITPHDDSAYRLEKEINAQDRASGYGQEIWDRRFSHTFQSVNELAAVLHQIHGKFGAEVENQITGEFYRVYELPVNELKIFLNGSFVKLDGNTQVVLYKKNGSMFMDRQTLETSNNFKFYNRYYLY